MNRMVENYLRYYCNYHQNDWNELLPGAEFAYNYATSEDIGMSLLEVDLRWKLKSPLDVLNKTLGSNESVEEFKGRLKSSLDDAKYAYKLAEQKKTKVQF